MKVLNKKRIMQKRAFTLLELIIVIIIIGILAVVGFSQYQKTLEKSRFAEAKRIIGHIRKAQWAYYFEHNVFTMSMDELGLDYPKLGRCNSKYWYSFLLGISGTPSPLYTPGDSFSISAYRCTQGDGGKEPPGKTGYRIGFREYLNGTYTWADNLTY